MLLAFGLDHIIISERTKDPKASRFLENTATTRGKPSFTAEAGRSGPVVAADVAVLVNGSIGTMRHLKMLAGMIKPVSPVHRKNASRPMEVTLAGMVTLVSPVHSVKA